jgi:hypothetical protein
LDAHCRDYGWFEAQVDAGARVTHMLDCCDKGAHRSRAPVRRDNMYSLQLRPSATTLDLMPAGAWERAVHAAWKARKAGGCLLVHCPTGRVAALVAVGLLAALDGQAGLVAAGALLDAWSPQARVRLTAPADVGAAPDEDAAVARRPEVAAAVAGA